MPAPSTLQSAAPAPPEKSATNDMWYKDAIIYELHVRSFADSDGDGIGDFPGLTSRLDYLRDLGVTALWLLPFYPSPLRDDGYDIADYVDVNPSYGTLDDFKTFLREAHRRDIRVITELVMNHTSDQHPWFQRARRAPPGSNERNFYVWSDTPEKYRDARIIFKDFEPSNWTWDPVAKAYYWHRFYNHQPDLNFDNPAVKAAMFQVLDFWLDMGVDGLRLDAVPYLFERDGTNCENLPETHALLRELRHHVDRKYGDRMLLAEANQWPEDAVQYFGQGAGDEVHTAFNFPLMPRLFMGIRTENRFPIVDILEQTPQVPETAQWLTFLRNHDELTLEMVTDEERDYMYRVYAVDPRARINLGIRRRLAPLLGGDRRKIELMNGLLFALPGTPVIYYGDEIGMGDNIYLGDRNGVRTPMQWSGDRNAGFSRANPQRLFLPIVVDPEYHYEAVNVEAQLANPSSLLWWVRQLIALRKKSKVFGRGTLDFLQPENRKVLAFTRGHGPQRVLVVANLSRHTQFTELDLASFEGYQPIEMSGRTKFPPISGKPYPVTLGPYDLYLLELAAPRTLASVSPTALPEVRLSPERRSVWDDLLSFRPGDPFEAALATYLQGRRWFRGKARVIQGISVDDTFQLSDGTDTRLNVVRIDYTEGEPERYLVSLALAQGPEAEEIRAKQPAAAIAALVGKGAAEGQILYDPSTGAGFGAALLDALLRQPANGPRLVGSAWGLAAGSEPPALGDVQPMRREQSNTSYAVGERFMLKLFRTLDEGTNPELELGRFLTTRAGFPHVPPLHGALELRRPGRPPITLAILQGLVKNEGDAWQYTLDYLTRFLERAQLRVQGNVAAPPRPASLLDASPEGMDAATRDLIGRYAESAAMLGRRTGELHLALASSPEDPDFAPEPFSLLYQRSLYQSMRSQMQQVFLTLRRQQERLPANAKEAAARVLSLEPKILARFSALRHHKIDAGRIRVHGDYHLGQVLHTGTDFVIIDFEGEPSRALSERRLKRNPLRDVAGMLRSFDYALRTAIDARSHAGMLPENMLPQILAWGRYWRHWVGALFLRAYLDACNGRGLLPADPNDLQTMLDAYMLDKAVYELGYELNNRPEWVHVPLEGILDLVGDPR